MALALRLFLLLLLAVALHARAAQAAPVGAQGADWDREMDYLEKLVNDSLNILELGGGPLRGKSKDMEDRKSLEAAKHLDQMLTDLEKRRVINRMNVLMAKFPRGSSGSLAASAEGREAMPGTVTGDQGAGKASPAAGIEDGLERLGASAGVSAGKTFPAPGLDAEHKPGSRRRGPPRGKDKLTEEKESLEVSEQVDQILAEQETEHEMDKKALLKAAHLGESDGTVPAPDTRREEIPDSATEDVISDKGTNDPDPVRLPRIVCPRDVRKSCMIGTVITVFTVPLVLCCCYFGIRRFRENRQCFQKLLASQNPAFRVIAPCVK